MKKLLLVLFIVSLGTPALAGDVYVGGHWKDTNRDGYKDTYVQPYRRTAPDNNPYNNGQRKKILCS